MDLQTSLKSALEVFDDRKSVTEPASKSGHDSADFCLMQDESPRALLSTSFSPISDHDFRKVENAATDSGEQMRVISQTEITTLVENAVASALSTAYKKWEHGNY